jgi:hypothetical protein
MKQVGLVARSLDSVVRGFSPLRWAPLRGDFVEVVELTARRLKWLNRRTGSTGIPLAPRTYHGGAGDRVSLGAVCGIAERKAVEGQLAPSIVVPDMSCRCFFLVAFFLLSSHPSAHDPALAHLLARGTSLIDTACKRGVARAWESPKRRSDAVHVMLIL